MILILESNAYCSSRLVEQENRTISIAADDDVEGWGSILLSIIVGLLALVFFLAMGGIFALVGPWLILAVCRLFRRHTLHSR